VVRELLQRRLHQPRAAKSFSPPSPPVSLCCMETANAYTQGRVKMTSPPVASLHLGLRVGLSDCHFAARARSTTLYQIP
jgi:hypothetical protein